MQTVSVVIPVKNSQRTIGRTVDSLLAQTYAGPIEVVLVGDVGDRSWDAVRAHIDEGRIRIIETQIETGGRDSNHKRNLGLDAATGDVLCLTDSDMVLPSDWVATGVELLGSWPCVAGPMASVAEDFWGTYVDGNPFAPKTPRMADDYVANAATLGRKGCKPPITANVFFTREVFERVGGLDPEFVFSYEDYEWFQRIVDAGFEILCTQRLIADHYHRQGWRQLVREYNRSGRGCAQFVNKHKHAFFSRKRRRDLATVCAVLVLGVALLASMAFAVPGATVLAAAGIATGLAGFLALSGFSVLRAGRISAVMFPAVTLILGLSFSAGMLSGLSRARATA
ncbi:glycosyltransferase [Solirubrobacter soli]|uniref:glycosyltransferase n=1 Tax=Solirubrobacter soli TaxID=363832 RepID=UPI0003FEDDF3|nr:glycosyltransferase [Solirubrobacter soli]